MKKYNFPKRFELEGLDPLKVKVQVVGNKLYKVYDNLEAAEKEHDLKSFYGPFADKVGNNWALRFETPEAYRILSS